MNKFGQKDPKTIFVCMACGKMSNDLYGLHPISKGWDTSCTLNAAEVYENKLLIDTKIGRVFQIETGGYVE